MDGLKAGDIVIVARDGWGFGDSHLGLEYTIKGVKSQSKDARYRDEYQLEGMGDKYHYSPSFILKKDVPKNTKEEEEEEENPNIKMITTFVPTWAKYMAMDRFGAWFVFSEEPCIMGSKGKEDWAKKGGNPIDTTAPRFRAKIGECDPNEIEVPWQETLHEV